jgi:ABC-type dipeptide/oligopeptide/nickel transport system permease subunit
MTTASLASEGLGHGDRPGQLRIYWKRLRRKKAALAALVFVALEILVAVFAPLLAPYGPTEPDYAAVWQLPSRAHWLGVDDVGRDVLSRLIYGARISLSVGLLSQFVIVAIGLPIGAVSALMGGWVDFAVMRIIEIFTAVPTILLYILMLVALGPGFSNIIIAMAVTGWVGIARLARGQVLSIKETDYVRAARAMGANSKEIILVHLMRNALSPVLVSITFGVPAAMFAEAGLSFLGLGIAPPAASWGQMMGSYQGYIMTSWHLTVFPAIVLGLTMLAWNMLGNGLRDVLDPSIRV